MATTDTVTSGGQAFGFRNAPMQHVLVSAPRPPYEQPVLSHETRPENSLFSLLNQIKSHPRLFSLCFCPLWDAKVLVSKRFHLSLSRVSSCGSFFFGRTLELCLCAERNKHFRGSTIPATSFRIVFTASSTNLCPQTEHFWPVSFSRPFF